MGMTSKYSRSLYDMAEHVEAIDNDCDCKECLDCCLYDFLFKTAKSVDGLELQYDELKKKNKILKQEHIDDTNALNKIIDELQKEIGKK